MRRFPARFNEAPVQTGDTSEAVMTYIFMLMDLLAPRYPEMDTPLDNDYSYEARHAAYERQHTFGINHAWHRR
jgi:hypothetical protein